MLGYAHVPRVFGFKNVRLPALLTPACRDHPPPTPGCGQLPSADQPHHQLPTPNNCHQQLLTPPLPTPGRGQLPSALLTAAEARLPHRQRRDGQPPHPGRPQAGGH